MEGPRACKKEERDRVLALINKTFRTSRGNNPSMGEEFQLLLGEGNLENMRIILENGEPVADVNFYKSTILIEGTAIKAASIGAVCTEVISRGKGYSSLLLDDCERLMKEDNARVMLVSGTRGLYLRRGCALAGKCYEFIIEPSENESESITLEEYKEELLCSMTKLYNKESTRFYRSLHEFRYLLKGATTPWGNFTYKTYAVKAYDEYCAYVVLRIANDNNGRWATVVEAAGDREMLLKALEKIIRVNSLIHIKYACSFNDTSSEVLKGKNISFNECNLEGTVKILDFEGLMKDLRPYFLQYVDEEIMENIRFYERESKYIFSINDESLEFGDLHDLAKLIFGDKEKVDIDLSNKPKLNEFFNAVFPIPFVWTANLNYQ